MVGGTVGLMHHELYLLTLVFEVPILSLFLPPIATGRGVLVSSGRPTAELYRAVLGAEDQLDDMDERLQRLTIENPGGPDHLVIGREHYRSWRSRCLEALMEGHGDEFDDAVGAIAVFVGAFRAFPCRPYRCGDDRERSSSFRAVRVRLDR